GVVFGELAQRLLGDDFVEEWLQASPVPLFENRVRRRLEPVLQSLLSPSRQLVELAPPAAGLRFPRQQTRLGQPLRLAVELRMRERPEIADRAADRSLELIGGRGAPEADQAQHTAGYGTQSHRRVTLGGGFVIRHSPIQTIRFERLRSFFMGNNDACDKRRAIRSVLPARRPDCAHSGYLAGRRASERCGGVATPRGAGRRNFEQAG